MTVTAVAPAEAGVEVGTVFVRSWGYDQTNIDYYKVVGLTPKGVRVQEWSNRTVSDQGPITYVVPGDGPAVRNEWPKVPQPELEACRDCRGYSTDNWGPTSAAHAVYYCTDHGSRPTEAPVETKRLSTYDGGDHVYIAVGNYNDHAYVWDGQPDYQTGLGFGH